MMNRLLPLALAASATIFAALPGHAQTLDSLTMSGFAWREIGPANFEGRVSDIVGIPGPSRTFFVASAGGGIWKTTNGGINYRPVFENERVVSMGALAIAPSDTMQVWAGSGEQNSRNSIEPGGGLYKSTDGGLTWKMMGLEKTEHIGRIAVHPTNPNVVYVAALGALWRTNPERGLYKTTDGGSSWQLIKKISDRAGFVDVQLDPKNPDVVWASSYERIRTPYYLNSGGPGSALWKSTDAGSTWNEIKGSGFPETMKGRIEIAIFPQDPNIVYAQVEADSVRGRKAAPGTPAQKLGNGLYRTKDGGKTWEKMNDANVRPFYYSQVRVHPRNPDRVWFSSTPVMVSNDGGKTTQTATLGIHVDHHAMWIDPNDPERMIVGNDGGVAISYDGGGSYDFGAILPISQFYNVSFDYDVPYTVCAGAQDNGSWCGPSQRKNGSITNSDWFMFLFGDGFVTQQDPTDPNIIYGESQGGNMTRFDRRTSVATRLVKPDWRPLYTQWEDSLVVARGDTTQPASRDLQRRLDSFRSTQVADSALNNMRWNWNTPYILSPHNPQVLYAGGNRVLKSTKRGDELYPISPDLSKKQWAKIDSSITKTGGITLDATGAETYGTIVSLAESPLRPGYLYAGTDDGNVWMTINDGANWEPIPAARFPGLPSAGAYVSEIEPSYADPQTFYVAFENHRVGDFAVYLYGTSDGGKSFRSLAANLPTGGPDYVHVIKEDPYNRDLLFVGTSVGAYVSLDRGTSWQKFMKNMPTVPVYDLKIHPRDRELIAATHGRGMWIVGIAPLEQMAGSKGQKVMADASHLFEPVTSHQFAQPTTPSVSPSGPGHQWFMANSPTYGAEIVYRIGGSAQPESSTPAPATPGGRAQRPQARLVITDVKGDTVQTLNGPATPGVHRVTWNYSYRRSAERVPLSPSQLRDSVLTAKRRTIVLDSLEKAGTFPAPVVAQLRTALAGGDMTALFRRGGGGGGGAPGGGWNPRPGEGPVTPPAGARPTGQAPAAGEPMDMAAALEAFPGGFRALQALLQPPGVVAAGFGGFGGGGAKGADTGDYLITLEVGGVKSQQVLRVIGAPGGDQGGSRFQEEEEGDRR